MPARHGREAQEDLSDVARATIQDMMTKTLKEVASVVKKELQEHHESHAPTKEVRQAEKEKEVLQLKVMNEYFKNQHNIPISKKQPIY